MKVLFQIGFLMPSFGVVVATFGDPSWRDKAEVAIESAMAAGADVVVGQHGDSLAQARNKGAKKLETDFVTFLDADDRLDSNFFSALEQHVDLNRLLLYKPQTLGLYPDGSTDDEPCFIRRDVSIFHSNSLVIGTSMRLQDFFDIGGFDDSLPILEDWDLFIRLHIAGAEVVECDGVIYVVGVNDDGRNSQRSLHRNIYKRIQSKYASFRRVRSSK